MNMDMDMIVDCSTCDKIGVTIGGRIFPDITLSQREEGMFFVIVHAFGENMSQSAFSGDFFKHF